MALVRYTLQSKYKKQASPSFEREYNLKYLGKIGNVFHTKDIEAAIEKGRKYNPDVIGPSYAMCHDRISIVIVAISTVSC
jgi:hypothetical protein